MSTLCNQAGPSGITPHSLNEAPAAVEESTGCVFASLIPPLRRALADSAYTIPTPVQAECIPHLLAGRDLMGSAQTGTGKTAAFVLPLLQYLAENPRAYTPRSPRVLILAPTRELAAQIEASIRTYGRHLRVKHAVVYGGVGQRPQEKAMSRGVDFLVATPGRLMDLVRQGFINLATVEAFVLDEADRMLDMGFIPDIRTITAQIPKDRQTLFFSATLSAEIVTLATTMLKDPVRVTIAPGQPTVERVTQKVMFVDKGDKNALLVSLLEDAKLDRVIVFTQMKHAANKVAEHLSLSGISAVAIHGNKTQAARMRALEGFRAGRVRALIATDVAARGIDVDGITHVINYNLPIEPETYVHRIGRTARAGAEGVALAFCSGDERGQLHDIERLIRQSIPVDAQHTFHSQSAATATGAAARQPARGGRNQFRGPKPGRGRDFQTPRNGRQPAGRGKGGFRAHRSPGRP